MKPLLVALAIMLAAATKDAGLRHELLHRVEQDQAARFAAMDWMKSHGGTGAIGSNELAPDQQAELKQLTSRIQQVDAENTKWL